MEIGNLIFRLISWRAPSGECVSWPLPEWSAPVDYVLTSKALMNNFKEEILESDPDTRANDNLVAELIAKSYLSTIRKIQHNRQYECVSQDPGKRDDFNSEWRSIFKQANECLNAEKGKWLTGRNVAFARWAVFQAPLICAPESGLPFKTANDLLNAWWEALNEALNNGGENLLKLFANTKDYSKWISDGILHFRKERLSQPLAGSASSMSSDSGDNQKKQEDQLKGFDNYFHDHVFNKKLESLRAQYQQEDKK